MTEREDFYAEDGAWDNAWKTGFTAGYKRGAGQTKLVIMRLIVEKINDGETRIGLNELWDFVKNIKEEE